KYTALQTTFGINLLALVDGKTKVLTLKQCLEHYLNHQVEIIRRRTQFELNKAEARAHILEGLSVALDDLDEVITLISESKSEKIEEEYNEQLELINELKAILADDEKVLQIIRDELIQIKEKFNDERRTEIAIGGADFFEDEDLIPEENIIITLTNQGYIKR